ncbi:cell envelope integrity protein CreD [Terriglobus sp. TAA 43]|uniref:cell envelope integrity protein CreD n=1 Tax=Terriglobus sp. TAA 43 TaxID=278961 RepID=UPI0009FF45D3|nr:cell envelope integrity protein CreD [Terriglobus sp. TAA 43]
MASTSPVSPISAVTGRLFTSVSMGMKLFVLTLLTIILSLFAIWINGLVEERTGRKSDIVKEISSSVGGAQTLLGPTLLIPYSIPAVDKAPELHEVYFLSATDANATVKIQTQERRRSLFRVPVFQADAEMRATFDTNRLSANLPQNAQIAWKDAEIVVGMSDARGAQSDAVAELDGTVHTLQPSRISPRLSLSSEKNTQSVALFGTGINDAIARGTITSVTVKMKLSGAQHIALLAYGRSTRVTQVGDWPSPGFDGAFAPVSREVTPQGFRATWNIPFIARGVASEGVTENISGLDATAMGVSLVEVADPYQSVTRALKYAPLFLGVIFLSYFVFEATTGRRVHVAQYVLVGVAQLIFYLLLLSFAEHIGFGCGFALGGGATVLLLAANAGWIFESRVQALRALGVFGTLYSMIYLLLRLEDNALMVGAIGSFLTVAAAMYFTRNMDWFGKVKSLAETETRTLRVGEL